jgi:hypothetical protein
MSHLFIFRFNKKIAKLHFLIKIFILKLHNNDEFKYSLISKNASLTKSALY